MIGVASEEVAPRYSRLGFVGSVSGTAVPGFHIPPLRGSIWNRTQGRNLGDFFFTPRALTTFLCDPQLALWAVFFRRSAPGFGRGQ